MTARQVRNIYSGRRAQSLLFVVRIASYAPSSTYAAIMRQPSSLNLQAQHRFRCPYHGWSYDLDGALKGTPEFQGVCDSDRSQNGLVPIAVDRWENFVFVNLDPQAPSLLHFLGALTRRCEPLGLSRLHFVDSRVYELNCNWKVFIDNYLDGGNHVPHLQKVSTAFSNTSNTPSKLKIGTACNPVP